MKDFFLGVVIVVCFISMLGISVVGEENDSQLRSTTNMTIDPALLGVWNLTQMISLNGTSLANLTNVEVNTNFTETKEIFGKSGCNRYFGTYNVTRSNLSTGSGISISPLGSTMMYCADSMDIEEIFLKILENSKEYRIEDNYLSLSDKGGNVLVFRRSNET
jgi:heat shock protein HslJ